MNVKIFALMLATFFASPFAFAQSSSEVPSVEELRDYVQGHLFQQDAFRASWQINRSREPDVDTFVRMREHKLQKLHEAGFGDAFITKHMEIFDNGKRHWLSVRETQITVAIELSATLDGRLEKITLEPATNQNWQSVLFLNGGHIVRDLDKPEGKSVVIEKDRSQLFFAARGMPALWALEYLDKCHDGKMERKGATVHWEGKYRDFTRHLYFDADTMNLVKAESRKQGELAQQFTVVEGSWPFPRKCLVREFQPPATQYATETVPLQEVERIAPGEIRKLEVAANDQIWDRRTLRAKKLNLADFLRALEKPASGRSK